MNIEDLAKPLDISRGLLFACRGGKKNITSKTWMKLEDAERRAGIERVVPARAGGGAYPERAREDWQVREPDMCDDIDKDCNECEPPRIPTLEERMANVERLLIAIQASLLDLQPRNVNDDEKSG